MQDLNDLRYFAAVVDEGGVSAAARALRVPKSTISKRLARLERELDVRLVERSTRRFRVTEVGRDFHRHCAAVLEGVEAAEAVVADARGTPRGTVRVGCPPGLSSPILTGILPAYMAANPAVRIELLVSNRRVDLIEEGVDIALRARSRLDADPTLIMRTLGRSRRLLVATPAFAAAHEDALTVERLGTLPTLAAGERVDGEVWRIVTQDGRTAEIRHRPRLACVDFDMLRAAALAGLGVGMLPQHACIAALRDGTLVQVLPEWHGGIDTIHLVFTARRGLLPAVRALIDHLAAALPPAIRREFGQVEEE